MQQARVRPGDCVKETQRASASNGPYSKSKGFQKETAPRAARFELCFCKAGRPRKEEKRGERESDREREGEREEGDILNPKFTFLEGEEQKGGDEGPDRAGRNGV